MRIVEKKAKEKLKSTTRESKRENLIPHNYASFVRLCLCCLFCSHFVMLMWGNLWSINLLQLEDIVWSGGGNDCQPMQITFQFFPLHIRNFYNFLLTSISLNSTFPHHCETAESLLCADVIDDGGKSLVFFELLLLPHEIWVNFQQPTHMSHIWNDSATQRKTLHEMLIVDMSNVDKTDEIMESIHCGNSLQKRHHHRRDRLHRFQRCTLYGEFCFCCYFTKPTQFHNAASYKHCQPAAITQLTVKTQSRTSILVFSIFSID